MDKVRENNTPTKNCGSSASRLWSIRPKIENLEKFYF